MKRTKKKTVTKFSRTGNIVLKKSNGAPPKIADVPAEQASESLRSKMKSFILKTDTPGIFNALNVATQFYNEHGRENAIA
jgi:fatty acid/phospholipid biosynthesis enzyme